MLNHDDILARLLEFQRIVRNTVIRSRARSGLSNVNRDSAADTIYQIDTLVEPLLEDFCAEWAKTTPLVLIAEGLENERGEEGMKVFPESAKDRDCPIRLIVDPIDGTRGIMYDKRPAWALAGVAPNRGDKTRLSAIEVSVMTEPPTRKMGFGDVLGAIKGRGAQGRREDLASSASQPLRIAPSSAPT